jgi:putative transposase
LKKALLERALGAELTHHLGYEKGDPAGRGSGNSRNGTSGKGLLTDDGEIEIEVPRDRAGTFEPVIVANGQTRFDDFDEKIISLYGGRRCGKSRAIWPSSTAPRCPPI